MERYRGTLGRLFTVLSDVGCDQPKVGAARVVAAVVYRRSIVSIATNSLRGDPWQARYGDETHTTHAEILAIKRATAHLRVRKLPGYDLLVCRLCAQVNGDIIGWGLAKPCAGCQRAVDDFELNRVYYTITSGVVGTSTGRVYHLSVD